MYSLTIKANDPQSLKAQIAKLHHDLCDNVTIDAQPTLFEQKPQAVRKTVAQKIEDPIIKYVPPVEAAPAVAVPPPTFPGPSQTISPAVSGQNAELDSRGIPWDERIHAATKAKTKDGSWRTRRNVEAKDVLAIESQSRNTVAQPAATQIPPAPQAPQQVAAPAYVPPPAYQPPPVVQAAPPVQAPVEPPPAYDNFSMARKQAHDFKSFKETLIPSLAKLVTDGKITQEYINSLKGHFGVAEIWQVNDQQLAEMFEQFAQYGLINKVG